MNMLILQDKYGGLVLKLHEEILVGRYVTTK